MWLKTDLLDLGTLTWSKYDKHHKDRVDWRSIAVEGRKLYGDIPTVAEPLHYTSGKIESIDYMKDNMSATHFQGYLIGSIKKYLHRFTYKGKPVEDLKKASWYLDKLIKELETAD